MCLIVGLGNPGKKYERTRHNVGFLVLDELVNLANEKFKIKKEVLGNVAEISIENRKVILLKPNTFMNLSGEAVAKAVKLWREPKNKVVIIFDDVNLPVGKIRVRTEGSAGGHNGMKSIIEHLGTNEIARIRIGIGRPVDPNIPLDKWVLGKFSKDEWKKISEATREVSKMIAEKKIL